MNTIVSYHQLLGATLADDGIPLHYGDLKAEYQTAFNGCILLDRSHEGRLLLTGDDRFELVNRMSTNKLVDVPLHEGRPTIFTNANARILFRVVAYNRPEGLFIITEPGQGNAVADYLSRNIFYGDKVKVLNIEPQTHHFALHGITADAVIGELEPELVELPPYYSAEIERDFATFTLVRRKTYIGQHWAIICQKQDAVAVHQQLLDLGKQHSIQPAGSLTHNILRIRAGHPAGRELSQDYIPLEIGLWDEVSFAKGCYTGQEIIARMESRERLAKTIVKLSLSAFVSAPAILYDDNLRPVGTLTSSVESPDGEQFGIGIIKTDIAKSTTSLTAGDNHIPATIIGLAGQQPSFIYTS